MQKIIRNTTSSGIFIDDTGVYIDSGKSYVIDTHTYLLWANSLDIIGYVNSGDLVINDGFSDLSPSAGLRYLQYPDRLNVKLNSTTSIPVVTSLNFSGSVSVTDNGDGAATVNVNTVAETAPSLREVTLVLLGGTIPINTESNLLFEPDPVNSAIKFYREETL
jgi:hypothetical protein